MRAHSRSGSIYLLAALRVSLSGSFDSNFMLLSINRRALRLVAKLMRLIVVTLLALF